jgi:hypothetical protein
MNQSFNPQSSKVALPDTLLPVLLLCRYLFFLTRRPISQSNLHYMQQRIQGLKSVGELLAGLDDVRARAALRLLRGMNTRNFIETAEQLQLILLPFARTVLPSDYILADLAPPSHFIAGAARILLISGPAIGIGDEMITFSLAPSIKEINPDARITLLSGYSGLWERVAGVDSIHTYQTHAEIVSAMRGESPLGAFDLVILTDFEHPDLYHAICGEPKINKYLEISLGARLMTAVDRAGRWIYRLSIPTGYFDNYYFAFQYFLRSLGSRSDMDERFSRMVSKKAKPQNGALRVYVSPFTSKYDPSPRYWSRLLSSLIPSESLREVNFIIDPGPNAVTRHFASEVARSVAPRGSPRISFEVAHSPGSLNLPIDGVLSELEQAQIVICADSFTAHAAPLMNCTTLVVANPGLENWRVPFQKSFYFDALLPIPTLCAGMRQILSHFGTEPPQSLFRPLISEIENQLVDATHDLQYLLDRGEQASLQELVSRYNDLSGIAHATSLRLSHWSPGSRALLTDFHYENRFRLIQDEDMLNQPYNQALRQYIQNTLLGWRNSNIFKYLSLVIEELKYATQLI